MAVGVSSSVAELLATDWVDPTAVPTVFATSIQHHTDMAPTSLPSHPPTALQPTTVWSQSPAVCTGSVPDSCPTDPVTDPPEFFLFVTSPAAQSPFQRFSSITDVFLDSLHSTHSTLSVPFIWSPSASAWPLACENILLLRHVHDLLRGVP